VVEGEWGGEINYFTETNKTVNYNKYCYLLKIIKYKRMITKIIKIIIILLTYLAIPSKT
jgi:hypothetical protein